MKNKKITSVFAAVLAGVLLTSPLNQVKAVDEESEVPTTAPTMPEKPEVEIETTEEKTTTEEKVVVTRWEDEDGKEIKPEKEGKTPAPKGDVPGYEFVKTDSSDPEVVIHIFKKKEDKEVITKWEDTEGKELKPEEKGKEEKKHGEIKGYKYERTSSKDGKTVTHIFKKEESKSSDSGDKKDADKGKTETTTKSEQPNKPAETTKSGSTSVPKDVTTTAKSDETTKSEPTTTEKTKAGETTTVSTTEKPVPPNATDAVTTGTNSNGEQNPITQSTESTTTKKGTLPTPPKYTSIFVNEKTGYEIANAREGKSSIAIAGYGFVRTVEAEDNKFIHYYRANEKTNDTTITTVWKDIYSQEQLLSARSGNHDAGSIAGYSYVKSKKYGSTTVHYFKKVTKEKKVYNWSFHRDVDTGEIIYYDFNRTGWHHPISILGYSYVDTDAWTDSAGITYHTHYYKKVSNPIVQVDPAKVFTVWVDEHYNQILPSRMGSHEAGELEGYEFERTVSINSGYGIAHVFKKKDGEERLAGKDKDKSMGYRVRSMLPRTSATGETNYLPLGIAGGVGAAVGAGIYYVLRRKENNDQNNNNFPPYSGQ